MKAKLSGATRNFYSALIIPIAAFAIWLAVAGVWIINKAKHKKIGEK